ncbi:G/T mismatch-specific thymine DNA glycosylase-like [Paramacrobiotus metropolitanus]|uniref:G/T mismatch-specific thymine DNA glycosylase-like n=1 Tax=Paramacrobiotus metropolitanus TaxID=2943436 RepID=UPI002445BEDF|nr:G/T mismatch-specific thymine DNA glycosylase-like [Paramacrobiotus metropolitanus]
MSETDAPDKAKRFDFSHLAFHAPKPSIPVSADHEEIEDEKPKKRRKTAAGSESHSPSKLAQTMSTLKDIRLSDFLRYELDIIIVGFNPGRNSASHGHHYAGPGNHFWKCLHLSGLVPEPLTFHDDARITEFGIGLTNIVSRPSSSSSELSKAELREGAAEVRRKMVEYEPKIVVFNGVGIYEAFSGTKTFRLGRQEQVLKGRTGSDILLYVMPSSSPRGSKWPRLEDKLKFYQGVVHLREFIQGKVEKLEMDKVVFD